MKENFTKTFLILSLSFFVSPVYANPWAINELKSKHAPYFELQDLKGRTHNLSAYKGSVIVLNFWATWCPPCKEELKSLELLYTKYNNKKLVILAISVDRDIERVKRFIETLSPSFPVLFDDKSLIYKKYNVFSVPTTFLIDKKGRIVDIFFGEHDWTSKNMTERIESLL